MGNNELYEDIRYGTNIIPEDEFNDIIKYIADTATEMVVKTLGPNGRTTIIDDGSFTYPTKDGWSILKRLRFNDPIHNSLYNVLKQVSFDLVSKVGDGTTSSFCGADIFLNRILDYKKDHDFRQAEFISALNDVVEDIIHALENSKYVKHIDMDGDFSDIYKIAYISSNGNEKLAKMIQEIYQKTNNPNIYVNLDPGSVMNYEIQTGYKYDCKPINQKVYRNRDDGNFTLSERAHVAFFNHNVSYQEHQHIITGLSRYASATNSTIFILAPNFDDVLLNIIGTSINSMVQQGQVPNIMLIQVPMSMTAHQNYFKDLVLLTNAQIFDYGKVRAYNVLVHNLTAPEEEKMEDALLNMDQYKFSTPEEIIRTCIGNTNRIVVSEKYLILQDYETIINPEVYKNTLKDVEQAFVEAKAKAEKSANMLQKDYMDAYQRFTKLKGNLGVINVGEKSELAKHCLKDSVDDAVLACRSAYSNGYIRGLNLAMLNIINGLLNMDIYTTKEHGDLKMDILEMIYNVFFEMSMLVLQNKYPNESEHAVYDTNGNKIDLMVNSDILFYCIQNECGYDITTDTIMSDETCTVINSAMTDIEILRGVVSILSMMLTSNQFLSVNRSYDRTMGMRQKENMMLTQKRKETEVIVDTIMDRLEKDSKKTWLQKLFRL